ncbi:MarR family winged helix-turn-helix transcriptional regulator [Oerskovia jenensis]|uniref:DNA-binding MarR family transcriptional regulator n=1 Tax=Oerskovia jenensis TaxID=162169 RepID=A0ABS2LC28_9CELL|nr:MarR family winged helix-turn-helix transcriptional regulator [Oerskovia jenensis]MBM7477976.1 DNA-binding MarR family transcriptional regulator [Oerskovia jenensis]
MQTQTAPERLRALPSWLLAQAALEASRVVSEHLAAVGAHRSHYAVLAALEEFGPASQAALGRRCGIDRSDLVALLDRLVADGDVERRPDPSDRRRNIVTLTPRGVRRLDELSAVLGDAQDVLLSALPDEDRDALVALLRALVTGSDARR